MSGECMVGVDCKRLWRILRRPHRDQPPDGRAQAQNAEYPCVALSARRDTTTTASSYKQPLPYTAVINYTYNVRFGIGRRPVWG